MVRKLFRSLAIGASVIAIATAAHAQGAPAGKSGGLDITGPPINRTLKRNPFVPPASGVEFNKVTQQQQAKKGGKKKGGGMQMRMEVPPPSFALAGILSGGGVLRALLVSGGVNVEAKVGDTVQGYKVTSINLPTREVVVTLSDHSFKVQLPKETPYGTKSSKEQPSAAPPAGTLPPPPAPAPAPAAPAKKGKSAEKAPKGG